MSKPNLQHLHQTRIAVDMEVSGRQVHVTGVATYERDFQLGPVLKIHIPDPAGDFDLVLREDRWNGQVVKATVPGCDYRISLTAADLCAQTS
jgi:hypothetical protein